ncbi:MAG: LiaF-related protein [Kofleriaceae bacterium]
MADDARAMIAVRDRRDQVIAQLGDQFSRDALEVDELERRLELAQRAESVAALDALVDDLPALVPATALAPVAPGDLDRPATQRLTAVFGAIERAGRWTVPRQLTAVAVFGATELDLREADLAPGRTELRVRCVFGAVELILPPGVAVETDASAIFGAVEYRDRKHRQQLAEPARSTIHITGVTVFGAVEIDTRLPGESRKAARKRAKQEAKALAGSPRAALPAATARIRTDDGSPR